MVKPLSSISITGQALLRWKNAWMIPSFRWSFLIAFTILSLLGFFLSDFFAYIQDRPGAILHDPVLEWLPPYDLSIPIMFCLYTPLVFLVLQAMQYPSILWKFITGFVLLHVLRMILMLLFPLETPQGFIAPHDPVQELFYGGRVISKDLFFSGHTAMVFWIYFSLRSGFIKKTILFGNVALMVMLLIQHIHYTIDILAALLFTIGLQHFFGRFQHLLLGNQIRFGEESI